MIYSSIYSEQIPGSFPPALQKALDCLRTTDFEKMPCGEYEIEGRDLFAQVIETETGPAGTRRPEIHRRHVDVQFLLSGAEQIGFALDTGKSEPVENRLSRDDIAFYGEIQGENFVTLTPGCFAVFFPNDIHRPACSASEKPEKIKKVILKIRWPLQ